MSKSTVFEELLAATGLEAEQPSPEIKAELVREVAVVDDDVWEALSDEAQSWYNQAIEASNKNRELPLFPGEEEPKKEEAKKEEPTRRRRRGSKKEEPSAKEPEAKEPEAKSAIDMDDVADLKEGTLITVDLKDGSTKEGAFLEKSRRYLVLTIGDDEDEIKLRDVERVTLAAEVEEPKKEEEAPRSSRRSSRPAAKKAAAKKEEPKKEEPKKEEPKKETPARTGRNKKTAGYLAKVFLIENPEAENDDVIAAIKEQGKTFSLSSLNVIRSELEMTLAILEEKGKLV